MFFNIIKSQLNIILLNKKINEINLDIEKWDKYKIKILDSKIYLNLNEENEELVFFNYESIDSIAIVKKTYAKSSIKHNPLFIYIFSYNNYYYLIIESHHEFIYKFRNDVNSSRPIINSIIQSAISIIYITFYKLKFPGLSKYLKYKNKYLKLKNNY